MAQYERLHMKAAMQSDLLGDPTPEAMTRELMLSELVNSLEALGSAS